MHEKIEKQFLEYLEGSLSEQNVSAVKTHLAECKACAENYAEFEQTYLLLKNESQQAHTAPAGFAVSVMENINRLQTESLQPVGLKTKNERRFFMKTIREITFSKQFANYAVATLALVLCFVGVIETNRPIENEKEDNQVVEYDSETHQQEVVTKTEATVSGAQQVKAIEAENTSSVNDQFAEADSALNKTLETKLQTRSYSGKSKQAFVAGEMATAPMVAGASMDMAVSMPYPGSIYPGPDYPVYRNENRENYGQYQENSWLEVTKDPLSTFSIDVDTGSYTNMRRFLSAGQLPPADSVRIEEYVNYFDYDYPTEENKPFGVNYEIAPSPLEPEKHLLKIGIKAKDAKQDSEKPWNLVFLIDTSGSMFDQNKLPLLQKSFNVLVNNMRPTDKVAIVTYAGSAGVALESTPGGDKQKILSAINQLNAGGSTNGSGGIYAAYDIAQKNFVKGSVNRVILATDGDFNVGISDFNSLVKLIEEKRKSGVTLTTLGFGSGNYNEQNLEQLANKGNGNYFYIDSFKEARKVLGDKLAGNMEVVAKDVKLQIEFNPALVKEYRLVGYENRKLRNRDFEDDKIDAGEIGSGHTVTALYEVILANSKLGHAGSKLRYQKETPKVKPELKTQSVSEFAFLKIRYKEPEGEASKLLEYPFSAKSILESADKASSDFKFASAVSYFGHLLRKSEHAGSYNFTDVRKLAESSINSDTYGYQKEFVELVKNAEATSGTTSGTPENVVPTPRRAIESVPMK